MMPPRMMSVAGVKLDAAEDVSCLYWLLQGDQDCVDAEVLEAFHEELEACSSVLGVWVVEGGATSGALARSKARAPRSPSRGKVLSPMRLASTSNVDEGAEESTCADNIVRLGQLLSRWVAKQDPPLDVRFGVHHGSLRPTALPWTERMGYLGSAIGVARRLAESAPRDTSSVHLSKAAKDELLLLQVLPFSLATGDEGFYLDAWAQVMEDTDGDLTVSPFGALSPARAHAASRLSFCSTVVSPRGDQEDAPTKRRSSASASFWADKMATLDLDPDMTTDEFRDLLIQHNVDVWAFGRGQAKSLDDFYRRVVIEKKSRLSVGDEGLEQRIELVRINLIVHSEDGEDYELELTSEILEDGRARGRNQRFACVVSAESSWEEAMEECFEQKLSIDIPLQAELFSRDVEAYKFSMEKQASASTAGIMTTYLRHEVTVHIVDPTRPELKALGLPGLECFKTPPLPEHGVLESNWAWNQVGTEGNVTQIMSHFLKTSGHGIDVEKFDEGALAALWEEVGNAKYSTLAIKDGELERTINVVKVWISTDLLSVEHVLVKRWQLERGAHDPTVKDRPVSARMPRGKTWEEAALDSVQDKLGLELELQREQLNIDERSYRLSEEAAYSSRYPGLKTMYRIHEVKCRIADPTEPGLALIGLPEGTDFTVTRVRALSTIATGWSWKPLSALGAALASQRGLVDRPSDLTSATKRRLPTPRLWGSGNNVASDNCKPQLPLASVSSRLSRPCVEALMKGQTPNLERALNAAQRIRDDNYTCRHFFEDCSAAFPELSLYVVGADDTSTEGFTSGGRTADDEYQRTMGALFALYWIMRWNTDGARSFCFGVDNDWYPLSEDSPAPARSVEERQKRQAFLKATNWEALESLFVDAGLLKRGPNGQITHDVDRTLAMLVLTAIHDIMKVPALVPVVEEGCGPWCGYEVGEKVSDHDAALGYVLEFMPEALPSFAMLPKSQQRVVKFTQCKMDYNMGWLVQAEAPPGALFSKFKAVMRGGEAHAADVSFYFVHWLTDLAGAEPCPQEGCEKFVLNFPQRVLASFLSSFGIVQHLSFKTESEVFEDYLIWRWNTNEGKGLGFAPSGPGSIALMRLVVMAQGKTEQVMQAFQALPEEDARVLREELGRTGCAGQHFKQEGENEGSRPGRDDGDAAESEGPALLVYYSPALMQKAGKVDARSALIVLADIFRQARALFPLKAGKGNMTAIVSIGALKDLEVKAIKEPENPGDVWVLQKVSSKDASVKCVNLAHHQRDSINWTASKVLFSKGPQNNRRGSGASRGKTSQIFGSARRGRSRGHSSHSPSPNHSERRMSFWDRETPIVKQSSDKSESNSKANGEKVFRTGYAAGMPPRSFN